MNNPSNYLSAKMKLAATALAVLSLFSLLFFQPLFAVFASPDDAYADAATAILEVEYYPYNPSEQPVVEDIISDYSIARSAVPVSEHMIAAEAKYNTLTAQKISLTAYLNAANNIVKIISYASDTLAAELAMNAYVAAKNTLINSYSGTLVMLYVNSNNADSKFALLQSEKNTYVDCILALPYPEDVRYEYTGEPITFNIRNRDSSKMTITGREQTEANENGYDVKIALKDKAKTRWDDGSVEDLHYKFKIMKRVISDTDLNAISFENKTFLHTGETRTLEMGKVPAGLSVDYITVNGERTAGSFSENEDENGKKTITLPFSTTQVGEYVITAYLVPDSNHAIEDIEHNRLSSMALSATLIIKNQTFSSNNLSVLLEEGFNAKATFYAQQASVFQRENLNQLLYENGYINSDEQVQFAYLTYLVVNSEETQPNDVIHVTLLLPENLRNKEFSLFQITKVSPNVSEVAEIIFETSGNYLTFQTSSFSSFAFVSTVDRWYSNVGNIIAITLVSLLLVMCIFIFTLYILWKKRGRERVAFLLPLFQKMNKVFHGTTLNDIQLVERGKRLLEKANEQQKIEMEKKTLSQQQKKQKAQMEENLIAIKNLEKKKKDKNAKSKR